MGGGGYCRSGVSDTCPMAHKRFSIPSENAWSGSNAGKKTNWRYLPDRAARGHSVSGFFGRLSPFPLADLPVVAGDTSLECAR